ncbi:uncharacterized protein LOC122973017 [Xyrichtys novacula]|uniref:Uncharacterized protein LOC122973017 n=2 Tax=Xyrichtys novacula TaxID=13765 RepID=A0AAV1F2M9_XYRNO|nr:uncharacterized protein LOC122973017 [Xyrichtys novacula]
MALLASGREKFLLSICIIRLPDDYEFLPVPRGTLQMYVTNLRNRPVERVRVVSLKETVMSLYHNLITGSGDFPVIHFRGPTFFRQESAPFRREEDKENSRHPSQAAPPGMMVPLAGYTSRTTLMNQPLPERVELRTLGDPWTRVHSLMVDGRKTKRVISTVFDSHQSVVTNRWRITDYSENGQCLMSVLCRFTAASTRCVERPKKRKRGHEEEDQDGEGSCQPQPKRRPIRV